LFLLEQVDPAARFIFLCGYVIGGIDVTSVIDVTGSRELASINGLGYVGRTQKAVTEM